jgi:hypothetical protein
MPDAAVAIVVAVLNVASPASGQAASPSLDDLEALLGEFIRASGYECSSVRTVDPAGSDNRGDHFRVECGQLNGRLQPVLAFRITVPTGKNAIPRVSPWR